MARKGEESSERTLKRFSFSRVCVRGKRMGLRRQAYFNFRRKRPKEADAAVKRAYAKILLIVTKHPLFGA